MRPDLLLIALSLVYVAASQPLNLYMLDSNSTCLQQNEIFDSAETLAKTLEHTTSLGIPGSMSLGEIKVIHMKAPGCNIRQSARGIFIAMALDAIRDWAILFSVDVDNSFAALTKQETEVAGMRPGIYGNFCWLIACSSPPVFAQVLKAWVKVYTLVDAVLAVFSSALSLVV